MYENTGAQTKNCNRGTALDRDVGKLGWGVEVVLAGGGGVAGLKQFWSRKTTSLIMMQLQITNICSVSCQFWNLSIVS